MEKENVTVNISKEDLEIILSSTKIGKAKPVVEEHLKGEDGPLSMTLEQFIHLFENCLIQLNRLEDGDIEIDLERICHDILDEAYNDYLARIKEDKSSIQNKVLEIQKDINKFHQSDFDEE